MTRKKRFVFCPSNHYSAKFGLFCDCSCFYTISFFVQSSFEDVQLSSNFLIVNFASFFCRETRTRKRRKKLKKKASKLKSSPKMSLQDTTFFLLLQQPTQSTTNKIENKNGVLHTQSTRHRLFIKKRLATTTLSEKSRTSLHKIIPRRSSPRPLNSHSSSLE